MMTHATFPTASLCLLLGACQSTAPAPETPKPSTPTHASPKSPEGTRPPAANTDPPSAQACAPMAELARLDPRTPLPLQPMMAWHQKQNMMEHLVAIQRITAGLANEDWDEVARASAMIETSPQMQQMCQHMGAGAEGFTEMAFDFHRRADAIGVAARKHDRTAVLQETSSTLQSCTGCHATFRQEVVDASAWQARTGSDHEPAHHPGHSPVHAPHDPARDPGHSPMQAPHKPAHDPAHSAAAPSEP